MSEPDTDEPDQFVFGRAQMPPLDNVKSAKIPRISRRDGGLCNAFGLNKDKQHWARMKADAVEICLAELPPVQIPIAVKHRLGLTADQFEDLKHRRDIQEIKDFVWEFALQPWRERYDYDLQYLQKRYPDEDVKELMCECIARWNEQCGNSGRQFAEGRDLKQLYLNLTTGKAASIQHTFGCRNSYSLAPKPNHSRIDDDFTLHQIEPLRNNDMVYWPNVVLDIQHLDQIQNPPLVCLAFSFICGPNVCAPSNIQMDIIRQDLQAQDVNTDDFSLRLEGSQGDYGWGLRDICLALTLWCRSRSDEDFDVSLRLVPRNHQGSDTEIHRNERVLTTSMKTAPTMEKVDSWNTGADAPTSCERDTAASSPHRYSSITAISSPTQVYSGTKREMADIPMDDDELSQVAQDPRPGKRMRKEGAPLKWQQN